MARDIRRLIAAEARRVGLDPAAVLAVAAGEGGFVNREGDIGDLSGGGSYGPFQLYAQGALPSRYRGNAAAADSWAWSLPGVRYALGKMVDVGARGLRGERAVDAIIRKFERPADPDSSVRNAQARLGQFAGFSGATQQDIPTRAGQAFKQGPAGIVRGPNPQQALAAQQAKVNGFLQMATNTVSGNFQANWGVIQSIQAAQQQLAAANQEVVQSEAQARQYGGTTMGTGRQFEGTSPQLKKILEAADAQIGKPYVWGAESPSEGGFDCSGLIDWAFRQAGIQLPGRLTTYSAVKMGASVKGKPMKPGDWLITNGGEHMVMYVGNGQVIAAPRRGERVQYQPVSRFEGDIVDVRRVLK